MRPDAPCSHAAFVARVAPAARAAFPALAAMMLALACVCVCGSLAAPARAATLQPALAAHLERTGDAAMTTALLFLSDQADVAGLERSLVAQRATRAERHQAVVTALREAARRSQGGLLDELAQLRERGTVAGYTPHWITNLVVVRATRGELLALAARADIARIELSPQAQLITPVGERGGSEPARGIGVTPGLRAIKADRVWRELGVNGAGILVANLDTGVDGKHPALAARWRGANGHPPGECWLDVIGDHPGFPSDDNDHGTHVMGTITGLGAATGDTIGVAWAAQWIACNAIDESVSSEFDNDILAAFEWFADPDGDPQTVEDVPHVIENSWGVSENFPGYHTCDDRWWEAIDHCEAAGAATVWSAGNNGPDYYSIGSPADRIASPVSSFSVGALDATHSSFPYPIAEFSSRGPSGCDSLTLKPEVAAPGVDVYSSIPGGRYLQNGWSGTSMAGPHVAGTIALMAQVNPDLTVDQLKQILLDTAVDLGRPGEDNVFGKGIIDAYAACLAALGPHGTVAGTITNASNGGTPVAGVAIRAVEPGREVPSRTSGAYSILLPPGAYTFTASHPSFSMQSVTGVQVAQNQTTTLAFALTDIGAPHISGTTRLDPTDDTTGPYVVETRVTDFSALNRVRLSYRVNGGGFTPLSMTAVGGGLYRAAIPGKPLGSEIEYYVEAVDVALNAATDPPGAPAETYGFLIVPIQHLFADDVEAGAGAWTHAPVTPGFLDEWHRSGQRNHTTGGAWSWKCGSAIVGQRYADSLDAGLVSPLIALAPNAQLRFWHWVDAESSYAFPGHAYDGGLVEIQPFGGAWQIIEPVGGYPYTILGGTAPGPFPEGTPVFSGAHDWSEARFDLSAFTGDVRLRLRFGSDGAERRAGWFIDDIRIDALDLESAPVAAPGALLARLRPNDPNPFTQQTRLRYELAAPAAVRLQIFDPAGRLVRTLVSGPQPAGLYEALWDGRDARARALPPGLYFSRLQAGDAHETGKLILMR
jgi:subtilisin family serine protease